MKRVHALRSRQKGKRAMHRGRTSWKILLAMLAGVVFYLSGAGCIWATDVFDLGEVVITATRIPHLLKNTPGSLTVISEEKIQSSRAKNLGELLEEVAGVIIRNYGLHGMTSISLRGSSSEQVLIMIDGRPLNLASSGDIDLSLFSLEHIKQIEVARGPFSSLYGSGALGGVVNILTKSPEDSPVTRMSIAHGSFDSTSYDLFHSSGTGISGYLLNARKSSSEGYLANSGRESLNVDGKITYGSLVLSGGYIQTDRELPGSLDWHTLNASQKDRQNWLALTNQWKWGTSNLSFKAFLNQAEIVYEDSDWEQKDTTTNKTYGVDFQHVLPGNQTHNIIWGFSLEKSEVNAIEAGGTSKIGGKRFVDVGALYVQDEITAFPNLMLVAGARYDEHSVYGSQVSPKLSFLYDAGEFTTVRASWGRAFRSPTVNDLYWQEDWGWGTGLFGNPDLLPEKSSGYEIGVEHVFSPQALARVTLFTSDIDNLITWTETEPWRWEAQNVDTASIKGWESEIRLEPWKKLSLLLSYTYLEAKDTKEFQSKSLPYRPENKFSWNLEYKLQENLYVYVEGKLVGDRYTNRENTEKLPAYSLLGGRITYKPTQRIETFIKVENILDERYEDMNGYPMPGTTVSGGVDIIL